MTTRPVGRTAAVAERSYTAFAARCSGGPVADIDAFPHAGIQTAIWPLHQAFALARDFGGPCPDPESSCGGRAYAHEIQALQTRMMACETYSNNWFGNFIARFNCQKVVSRITSIDYFYLRFTGMGWSDQDGVVPLASQFYPNTSTYFQYTVRNGVTHGGQTRSQQVETQLATVLRQFGVPQR